MILRDQTREHCYRDLISVDDLLRDLEPCLRNDLTLIGKHLRVLPDKVVFAVGGEPRNIYLHLSGQVALFQDDDISKVVHVRPVGPNCIYGLVEALSGNAYGVSMKTLTASEFDVIERDELLSFIQNHPALCFRLAEILSRLYQNALETIKSH